MGVCLTYGNKFILVSSLLLLNCHVTDRIFRTHGSMSNSTFYICFFYNSNFCWSIEDAPTAAYDLIAFGDTRPWELR